jgi:uncharacterized protein (UPF0276 family)
MAGGLAVPVGGQQAPFLADTHSHPVPQPAFELLQYALGRHHPETIVLERDDRLDATDEILADVERIRACVAQAWQDHGCQQDSKQSHAAVGSPA